MTRAPHVTTVRGPVPASDLGVTLTHEHLVCDVGSWWQRTRMLGQDADAFAEAPVTEELLWELRQDPFGNRDNCRLADAELALAEVARFSGLGGRTIVEASGLGLGRDLRTLRSLSEASGIHIVAGTGYYLDASQPAEVKGLAPEAIAERIVEDVTVGEDGIRPGIIGEIGVGADFTPAERASPRGALLAQRETGLPMQVHLPGWYRRGTDVLDLVEECGVDPGAVVLCHLGPSGDDLAYQEELLRRGAWVQYDMIGMEVFYGDQGVQCPSDEQNAAWLTRLADRGHLDRLLISQDVFLKSLLRRHGGPGYGHILQFFVPRLLRHGFTSYDVDVLLIDNPRRLLGGADRHTVQPTKENTP